MTAGLIFFGTPHIDKQSDALREALRNTASASGDHATVVDDAQAREYITAAANINRYFLDCPPLLRVISIWEEEPTEFVRQNMTMNEMVRLSAPISHRNWFLVADPC